MRSIFFSSFATASLAVALAACSSPKPLTSSTTGTGATAATRVLAGTVQKGAYAQDNSVVLAITPDGRRFLGAVQADQSFKVTVPTGLSYRLALANSLPGGGFRAIAAITWGAAHATWGHVLGAGTLALGVVRPSGIAGGIRTQSGGGGSSGDGGMSGDNGGGGGGDNGGGGSGDNSGGGGGGSDDNGGSSSGNSSGGDDDDSSGGGGTCECQHAAGGSAGLPYDVRPGLGTTFQLTDAFLVKGPLPASVVSVTLDSGGTWRLAELQANTPFVITQADCDHQGNRSTGRDRAEITWQNADGSTGSDHLDLRYCDGTGSVVSTAPTTLPPVNQTSDCEDDGAPVCSGGGEVESECDGDKDNGYKDDDENCKDAASNDQGSTCPSTDGGAPGQPGENADGGAAGDGGGATGSGSGTTQPPAGGGGGGGGGGVGTQPAPGSGGPSAPCTVTLDCAAGLTCVASTCQKPIP